jgi:hypothetical protein
MVRKRGPVLVPMLSGEEDEGERGTVFVPMLSGEEGEREGYSILLRGSHEKWEEEERDALQL